MKIWLITLRAGMKLGIPAATREVAKRIANQRGYDWTDIEEAKKAEVK